MRYLGEVATSLGLTKRGLKTALMPLEQLCSLEIRRAGAYGRIAGSNLFAFSLVPTDIFNEQPSGLSQFFPTYGLVYNK